MLVGSCVWAVSVVPTAQSLPSQLKERDARIAVRKVEVATMALMKTKIRQSTATVSALVASLMENSEISPKPPSSDEFVKPPRWSLRKDSGPTRKAARGAG